MLGVVRQLPGQAVYPGVPYSGQLKTDPAVGNVQGIQRYGRPLKTDPDQGVGFSYHVYPVAHPASTQVHSGAVLGAVPQSVQQTSFQQTGFQQMSPAANGPSTSGDSFTGPEVSIPARPENAASENNGGQQPTEGLGIAAPENASNAPARIAAQENRLAAQESRVSRLERNLEVMSRQAVPQANASIATNTQFGGVVPYSGPFDWTSGLRRGGSPVPLVAPGINPLANPAVARESVAAQSGFANPMFAAPGTFAPEAAAVVREKGGGTFSVVDIYHQPLIQIKMRIVEVARTDGLAVSSVLEYVSDDGNQSSLTSGNTSNGGNQNFRSLTRYALPNLVTDASTGTGTLVNLTTEHINWLLQTLATETNADVVTAPEMVTLNGQNVEFVAGSKLPFDLGQNVITGQNANIQQVFYKHVGTMVSVTPRIVNWGLHGEGRGEATVQASDVLDWRALVEELLTGNYQLYYPETTKKGNNVVVTAMPLEDLIKPYRGKYAIPYSVQSRILVALNDYAKQDLAPITALAAAQIIESEVCNPCRQWQPADCTIDLSLVVRLSEAGSIELGDDLGAANIESNVRAIANVIQVKSGHGVVMAGLIGEREVEEITKTPVLGDLPLVGSLFRAKTADRVKTEILIFVEAEVLDSDPQIARAESSRDFLLGQSYVNGEVLENPLEIGLYRAGIGPYLPAYSEGEKLYWQKFHRKLRRVKTHIGETLEP